MDYIYHYTSVESLLGLLHDPTEEEKKVMEANHDDPDYAYYLDFHASDLNLMNDKNENRLLKAISNEDLGELNSIMEYVKRIEGLAYCVSFCTEFDYIPMWKLYAAVNPICMKFKISGLEDSTQKINHDVFVETYMQECVYKSQEEFKQLVAECRQELIKSLKEPKALFAEISEIIHTSAFLKLDNFKYEQEYRLAAFVNKPVLSTRGKYGISLYQPIKIPLKFLEEIMVGPSSNQDSLEHSIGGLLKSKGYDNLERYGINIKVTKSHIELR